MAGSFGFEDRKYDLSMQIYEHELGPHLRELPPQRLVLADGFSCKTQIEQATDRRPLHLAELLHMARRGEVDNDIGRDRLSQELSGSPSAWIRKGAWLLGAAAVALGAWYLGRRIAR
jgi:hypothetical protein